MMKTCIYCGTDKPEEEFSDEHIWPDALGGDFLPTFWRSDDVCRKCNSMSGVFVDGAFIKSFFTSAERALDAHDYLDPDKPSGILPLNYLGTIQDIPYRRGYAADFWVCAPGANIVHFRAASEEGTWDAYAGGDPRRQSKRSKAGRVLISLTSPEPYWFCTALSSVRHNFPNADKRVTNLELPPTAKHFRALDLDDPQDVADLSFVREMEGQSAGDKRLRCRIAIAVGADGRFLTKLALGVGYKLFGTRFIQSPYGINLRRAFREANFDKRQQIPIRGQGYYSGNLDPVDERLRWPGGWVLLLRHHQNALTLTVQPPSGRHMVIQVTDDPEMLETLDPTYSDGVVWLTVPAAARALGPLSYPEYVAHQLKIHLHGELRDLAALRAQRGRLPPTGIPEQTEPEDGSRTS